MSDSARELVAAATRRLEAVGVPSPRLDAEVLLAHAWGVPRGGLLLGDAEVEAAVRRRFAELVERRVGREPLQHLTGRVGFRTLELSVGPGVFVPRPETELVAGAAIAELSRLAQCQPTGQSQPAEQSQQADQSRPAVHRPAPGGPSVGPLAVDLGTGSGAIAASLAVEVPRARVVAVELSPDAHAFAVRNAARYGVEVRLGDMAEGVDDLIGAVAVVVANPPYVRLAERDRVEPEVRDHDPAQALWSGRDGLDAIRVVAEVAARLLVDGGLVVCEHADTQGPGAGPGSAVAVFVTAGDWDEVADHPDLTGRSRYLTARRHPR